MTGTVPSAQHQIAMGIGTVSPRQSLPKEAGASRRQKLVFLACYFPPVKCGGYVRAWNITKYLARAGWDVTVVTPDPSLWRNIEDPHKLDRDLKTEGIRRILTGHRWRCLSPDDFQIWNRGLGWAIGGICRVIARRLGIDKGIGWVREAEHACRFLRPNDVDVILATGSPFAAFSLARRLAERLGRPYVLD